MSTWHGVKSHGWLETSSFSLWWHQRHTQSTSRLEANHFSAWFAVCQEGKTFSRMQVLAAISDDTIAVWDAHSGILEQRLRGHTFRTHVLECHPLDPCLVMSAGYDGQTIVWDLVEGQALARCGPLLCLCPLRDSHCSCLAAGVQDLVIDAVLGGFSVHCLSISKTTCSCVGYTWM